MKWQDKLTKKEMKHLRESGVTTLTQARHNAEHQKGIRQEHTIEPCFECKRINIKLRLPI